MKNLDCSKRISILNDLVNLSKPIDFLKADLQSLDWDYDGDPFVLKIIHLDSVLKRYISGEIDDRTLECWANLIETREDIDFENDSSVLQDIIYKISNPVLEGEISKNSVDEYIAVLSSINVCG